MTSLVHCKCTPCIAQDAYMYKHWQPILDLKPGQAWLNVHNFTSVLWTQQKLHIKVVWYKCVCCHKAY